MQIRQTYSLNEILKYRGEDYAQTLFKTFRCEKNEDIERFLFNNAIRFDNARIARTFLIFNEESDFLAYFTLSFNPFGLIQLKVS